MLMMFASSLGTTKDMAALTESLRTFFLASSLKVNWKKSKALWVPYLKNCLPVLTPPPPLPENLEWKTEGVAYLGVFLGSTQFMKKNWEDTTEEIRKKLNRWRRALPHLSFKGCVLVANNLVAANIWHRFICLQPPEVLLGMIHAKLVDFFWGGHH